MGSHIMDFDFFLAFLKEYGDWVITLIFLVAWGKWKTKRFRLLIDYKSKE